MSEMDQQTPYEMTSMRPEMRYETQPIFPEVDEDKTKTNKSSEHKVIPPRKGDDDDDDKHAKRVPRREIKYVGEDRAVAASEQVDRLSKSGTIWSAAKSGTIEDFDNAVKKGQNVNETGESFCETVLHVACLYSNTPVALHIAQKYPDLILKQQIGIHEGETALHIVVTNGDIELAKGLLDILGKLDDSNFDPEKSFTPTQSQIELLAKKVTGDFFDKDKGAIYLGDHALAFAVCSDFPNKKEMIRLLFQYGARLDLQDKYGNTLLHLCVEKNLPDMYNYILDLVDLYQDKIVQQQMDCPIENKENKSKLERLPSVKSFVEKVERRMSLSDISQEDSEKNEEKINLEAIKNLENRTPLTYAAVLGNPNMLQEIINRRRRVLWRYGPIISYAYPLEEIDSFKASLLTPSTALMLITYSSKIGKGYDKSLLQVTPFRNILDEKWNLFAKHIFLVMFISYALFLCALTLSVIKPEGMMISETEAGRFITLCQAYVFSFAWITILNESIDLLILRSHYFSDKGLRLFYFLSWSYSILIICSLSLRFAGYNGPEGLSLACAGVLAWIYVLYFTRGESRIGYYVVILRKMILTDVVKFLAIFFIFLFGFTLVFFEVYRNTGDYAFITYPWSMFTLFRAMLFDFDTLDVDNASNSKFTIFLVIAYTCLTGMLMLNMLIAMMNDTYSQVKKDSERRWELEWASVILFAERRLRILVGIFCFPKYSSSSWLRVGFQGKEIGINDKPNDEKYYLVVNEEGSWVPEKKKRLQMFFPPVKQRILSVSRVSSMPRKPSEHVETELELQ